MTNGDSASDLIEQSGIGGTVLPWRDVLHEGPVPGDVSDEQLRAVRAAFLSDFAGEEPDAVLRSLAARDEALACARDHDEVVLWFEHDLYDQLQLIQILDRLARLDRGDARLAMICIGSHPAIERFTGLGELSPAQIRDLFPTREAISPRQIDLGVSAWRAFSGPNPREVERLARSETDALPFLAGALVRHLAELPSTHDGLGRTERMTLEALADGPRQAGSLFRELHEREPHPFMGDTTYWTRLMALASCPRPLIRVERGEAVPDWGARVSRLELGERVAAGRDDFTRHNPIDRWWGGVHQVGPRVRWRWDESEARLRDCG